MNILSMLNPDRPSVSQRFHRPNPISLDTFPAETLDNIIKFLPKDALANLRLTSRLYEPQAKYYLYTQLTLRDSLGSVMRAGEIFKRDFLASLVYEFRVEALFPNSYVDDSFRHAIHDIRKLLQMDSLSIAFDPPLNEAPLSAETQLTQKAYRCEVFALFFLSLTITGVFPPELDRLAIENLQSQRQPYVTTTLGFLELLGNLSTLELGIRTLEHDMSSPRTREMSIETVSFYLELPQVWLTPASQYLGKLHLSADAPWGWYPKVDLRAVYFPNLRDLTLVRYTFSHDWQLQWLSDHAGVLQRLVLTHCAILDYATSTEQQFDSEGYVDLEGERNQVKGSHSHKKRWSHYFKAIESSLPQLQSFSLLAPDHNYRGITDQQALVDLEVMPIRYAQLYSSLEHRYLIYREGDYVPLFGDRFGTVEEAELFWLSKSAKLQQDSNDEQALRELLAVIQQRNRTRAH